MKRCQKCGKTMKDISFYTYKNGEKTEFCKKCLTMHVDNFDESSFVWLLEKMDVPYIPGEWNSIRDRLFAKDPDSLDGTSVFGRYLSKMRLKKWKDFGYKDSERLLAELGESREQKKEEEEALAKTYRQQLEDGEISEAQYKTLVSTQEQYKEYLSATATQPGEQYIGENNMFNENDFFPEEEMIDYTSELTLEDKKCLAIKWGRLYKPSEWIELEKSYNDMMNSFDITDADTINTLILLCKTNLKMNQSLDSGDIEGFQKLSKVSESLRKSAKFTAAQNKESKTDCVDSIGELIVMCEKEGFIPRYKTDIPQDKVDLTLKDMNNYLKKLVTQDLGFGQQIEDALKKIQLQKDYNNSNNDTEEATDIEDTYDTISDDDMQEYFQDRENLRIEDQQLFNQIDKGEE